MGAFFSHPVRSSGSDIKANLLWTLDEQAFWESELHLIDGILGEAVARSYEDAVNATGLQFSASTQPLTAAYRVSAARPSSAAALQQHCNAVLKAMDLTAGDLSDHRAKPYPVADPVHAHMARRSFAAAATSGLQASVTTISTASPLGTAAAYPYEMKEEKDNTVPVIEGPMDTRNTSTASSPAINMNAMAPATVAGQSGFVLLQQTRVELAAKFLFIFALVDKVLLVASHCYRMQARVEHRTSKHSSSLTQSMEQPQLSVLQPSGAAQAQAGLALSLLGFDRAKAALQWLRRDYELSYATYRVNELLMWCKEARDDHLYIAGPLTVTAQPRVRAAGDALVDSRLLSTNESEIRLLNALLLVLQQKAVEVEIAVQRNEKSSLDIALDYLDNDGDGRVTAADCSPADQQLLFPTLAGHNNYITQRSMRASMLDLSKAIERSSQEMNDLNALGTNMRTDEREEFEKALAHYQTDRSRLRRVHRSLHQAFVDHLFAQLSEDVTQSAVHVDRLRRDVAEMEARVANAQDPMEPQQRQTATKQLLDEQQAELVSNIRVLAHSGSAVTAV